MQLITTILELIVELITQWHIENNRAISITMRQTKQLKQ